MMNDHLTNQAAESTAASVCGSAGPNVSTLLKNYYQAVTHVCSTGLQLAGRLENDITTVEKLKPGTSSTSGIQGTRQVLLQINSLYSDIISNLGPLWKHSKDDNHTGGSPQPQQLSVQASQTVEDISKCFVDFHMSVIESGKNLMKLQDLKPPADIERHYKPELRRKDSPCIVITDTSSTTTTSKQQQPLLTSTSQRVPSGLSQSTYQGNYQVPSDQDMSSIIDFLSLTQTPLRMLPVKTSPPPINRSLAQVSKQPLSNQHSSPLPSTIKPLSDQEPSVADTQATQFVRHHSDWQLYANSKKDDESCMPTGAGGSLYTPITGGYNSRKLPLETAASNPVPSVAALPFSNWSLGGNKDNIWSHESEPSSGDESTNLPTQQYFPQNQIRRSSYDSSGNKQIFRTLTAPAAGSIPASSSAMNTWGLPAHLSSCWSSGDGSQSTDIKMQHQPIVCTHSDPVWRPIGGGVGVVPTQSDIGRHEHTGYPFSQQFNRH